jgi:GNAT superfamily N-acetyltransferase
VSAVAPVARSEVREAGAVLARALHDDPLLTFVFGSRRARLVRILCTATVRDAQPFGHVLAARDDDGRIAGVAAWLPPGTFPLTPRRELAQLPGWLRVGAARPHIIPKAIRTATALDHCHPAEEHWFLAMLGVDPARQGRGLGSELLMPVLERAGYAHLDTSKPANLPWYRRFGFFVDHELRATAGAPPSWALRYGAGR